MGTQHFTWSKGFDEKWCPKRFKCNAGKNVSIDVRQVCDGNPDCDDMSDESQCAQNLFSPNTEMIDNPVLRSAFWEMGIVVTIGNGYVVASTIAFVCGTKLTFAVFQRVIILNVSKADFVMGVYLLTIVVYSAKYAGEYGEIDHEWRSSLRCSVIGSLSVISNDASCFFLVILIAFRLMNVCQQIKSMTASLVHL